MKVGTVGRPAPQIQEKKEKARWPFKKKKEQKEQV
jgi:hypothetical protein